MARDIDITIKARNEANAELQRLSRELAGVSRALRDMSGPANQAASGNQKVARSFDDAGRSADAATGKVSRFGAEIARGAAIGAGFAGLNAVMRGVGAGLDFVADSAIGMNSRLEQSQVAFTTMLGSAERADSFLRDLGDFAKTTPFEFPELVQTSQRLLAMGFAAGEVIPLMTDIGNVASSLGRGTEGIDRIVMALGQMESKTRVQTEELLQLQEIGVPALQILADAMGVTVAESQKMVSAGQVASDVFIGAFQEWSQVNFGDMMEQQSRTMTGAISNITDTLQMAAADGLRPFFDLARDGAVELADFLGSPEFESFASDLSEDMAGAADAVRSFVSDNREGLKETAEAFGTIAQNAESAGQMIGTVAGALNELKVPAAVKLLLEDLATLNERLANTIEITLDFDARVDYGETTPDSGVIDKLWRGLVSGDMIGSLVGVGREHGEAYYSGIEDGVSNASGASGGSFGSDLVKEMFQFDAAEMGPFLDEIIVGPLLSMEPRVREELKGIFTLDPDIGASFAASITGMVAEGSVSFEEGMNILSAIPRETLEPALQEIESDLHGKLAEALISGEDTAQVREQLSLVQGMLGETSEFVASSAIGFNEFGAAGEMAMADVATAAGALQGALDGLAGAYQIGLDIQQQFTGQASEYASGQKNIEDALEAVQRKQEQGIELSEEELKLLDLGEDAIGRYVGGQEDATIQAGLAATANAELMRAQDDLNRAIADGETDLQPYLDRVKDAEQFARDMGLATDDNTSAQDDFFSAVADVITKLGELIDTLNGVPPKVTTEVELNTQNAINAYNGFLQYLRDNPGQSDLYVNQINTIGFTENNERGGPINKDTLSWVGEAGPELVLLPKGAHVYPHEESMGMANRLGIPGYATGTPDRPQLTDGERQAIRILGEMDVVITPESMAQADAELAALLDARAMAVELGLGDAIIAQLDEDIAAKQGEIDLIGRIAGSAWGEGFLSELEAVDATEAMAGLLGDFSLEDIVSGKAGTDLGQQFVDLLKLEKIAKQMGDLDLAAMYREQADAVGAELQRLGQVMGTEFVQGQIDGYNAEQVAEEWDARLADALAGPQFGQNIQASIDEMNEKIDLGILMGAPMDVIAGWQAERDQLVEEGATYWKDVTEAIAAGAFSPEEIAAFAEAGGDAFMDAMEETFSPEAIEHILNPVNQIAEAGYDALMDMFGDAPELAEGFIDDIVAGLYDGTFDYEQAMALLGQAGSDALIPGLEAIEKQLTVDLVNAIIAGNAELEADILEKLALLEQLQSELDLTTQAAERYVRGTSGIYYNPATTGMGGAGSGGGGGMGGSGGGYGGPNVQSSGGGTFEDDYVFNIGPDTAWAQSDPQMYQFTVAGQTLLNKFGLDLAHEGGPDAFGSQAEYLYYIAERVNRHIQNYPHLVDNEEFWKHVQTMGNGWLTKDKILNISNLSVQDGGESLVYTEGKKDLGGLGTGRGTSPPTGGSGSGVRAFADGGIITSPLFGLVGEAGPEMVQPLAQGHPERERLIADIAEAVIRSTDGGRSATFVVDGKVFTETVGKRVMHSVNGRGR